MTQVVTANEKEWEYFTEEKGQLQNLIQEDIKWRLTSNLNCRSF